MPCVGFTQALNTRWGVGSRHPAATSGPALWGAGRLAAAMTRQRFDAKRLRIDNLWGFLTYAPDIQAISFI